MSWYYASEGKQVGPVEQEELSRLVTAGVIKGDTLVWQQGMPEWKAYAQVLGASGAVDGRCEVCLKQFTPDELVRLDNRMVCATCKPLVLQRIREGAASGDDEQIRRDHVQHEASIKSLGILYMLGGGAGILAAGSMVIAAATTSAKGAGGGAFVVGMGVGIGLFAVLSLAAGIGLRKLKQYGRVIAGVVSGIGVLGFPIGTLIHGYFLYLLFSKKGKVIFSDEYPGIVERTPHIQYKTPLYVWIVVGLLILGCGVGVFFLSKS
jgi:hypothetical protein